jgi:hypothetical protein
MLNSYTYITVYNHFVLTDDQYKLHFKYQNDTVYVLNSIWQSMFINFLVYEGSESGIFSKEISNITP